MLEELLNGAKRNSRGRRLLTSEQKAVIVQEWEKSGLKSSEFSRRYGILAGQLHRWRNNAMRGATMGIKTEGDLYTRVELDSLRKENEELKKALGEASLDIKILKKKLETDAQKRFMERSKNGPSILG
ncbi:MAG: transposase [Elusimicrobia bacterium]|jgi:transposase-like protein|nr:transposase [Elusimicrobiota bacterium]